MKNNKPSYKRRLALTTITVIVAVIVALGALISYLKTQNIPVLQPKGSVGIDEYHLMIFTAILSIIVIVPVFTIAIFISFKYHEDNKKAKYSPNWDSNHLIEAIWWGIPILLILIVAIVTWISTHHLDPYKPLDKDKPALTIKAISLDWKWLFIYPNQGIASVNYVQFPTNTQIDFELTADSPMNSFWIPQLGGQMYTMAGMTTHQHLSANTVGDYRGSSANISGPGFAGMKFTAHASSKSDFVKWIDKVKKKDTEPLNIKSYEKLAEPSKNNPVKVYSSVDGDIFDHILSKYMDMDMGGDSHDMDMNKNSHDMNMDMKNSDQNMDMDGSMDMKHDLGYSKHNDNKGKDN